MSDTAVWLAEHVIPMVQIRQGVCTLPWELRVRVGYDRELCAFVVDTFVRELQRSYLWRAKRELGLSSVEDAFTGMGTVIQRFDSALRLNVYFHTLVLDGVYVKSENGERLRFFRLPRPSEDDVYRVAMRTATKVKVYLEKRWRTSDSESNGEGAGEIEPALGACYDVVARVPPPWFNMIRFYGVLAPNAQLREQVVASARLYVSPSKNTAPNPLHLPLFGKEFDEPDANASHKRRKPGAWLLKHVFAIDVNVCPKCSGRMKWRQVALAQEAIREGLARAGLP